MSMSLPRKTLTVGVMAGAMVCTAMVSAQSVRSRQADNPNPNLGVIELGRIAADDASPGCPASSCVSQPGQCTLTQSLDTVTIGATVRCAALFPDGVIYSTPNGWARSFNMAAEGLQPGAPQFTTKSVTFGVQTVILTGDLVDIQVDIVLYADSDGGTPPGPGSAGPADPTITELAREIIFVTPADVGTFITVPIVGVLELGAGDLIVEIVQLSDGTEEPLHAFRPISNDGGACAESYLRAAACGIPGWIALCGGIGFCDNEYVIIVEGELGPPPCPATTCSNICDCSVTQSNNTENIETQVACASEVGTTDQGWARCFDFAAEGLPTNPLGYTIQSVTFGVLIATVDGIEVDVAVYAVDSGCRVDFQAPGDPGVTQIARESILVDIEDVDTFITVQLSDKPKVADDATIVVEIEQLVNGSVEDPAGQFSFRPSGNTNGECDISYIRAALCGLGFWIGYDFIGFGFIHTTIVVDIESNKKSAFVDIKPGSCPNPLNRDSNGVLPVALTFDPDDKSVQDVDLSTLQIHRADGVGGFVDAFSGRPGPKRNLEDVMTPFGGEACDCHGATGDGVLDVQMKFDVAELRSVLELDGVPKRTLLELCITGRNNDGTPFIGCDCVRIQGRGSPR